jgi:ribosomal protein L20
MAYNSRNHRKKIDFVMKHYEDWKQRNGDIPDTHFVRVVLRDLGHSMTYTGFMQGYKHKKKSIKVDKKQLLMF